MNNTLWDDKKLKRRALICALLSYIMAYAWTTFSWKPLGLLLTAVLLVGLCEAIQKGVSRSTESWVWLGCFAVCCFSLFMKETAVQGIMLGGRWLVEPIGAWAPADTAASGSFAAEDLVQPQGLGFCRVWDEFQLAMFVHIFAVWWILARSGMQVAGESSRYLLLDALNAFIALPFGNFFLRTRTIAAAIKERFPEKKPKEYTEGYAAPGPADASEAGNARAAAFTSSEAEAMLPPAVQDQMAGTRSWTVIAAIASLCLFASAVSLLGRADATFGSWFESFLEIFRIELDIDILLRFFFSLPVGMYLFGLMAGARRHPKEKLSEQLEAVNHMVQSIRKVPEAFWTAIIGLFSLLYLAFFVLQGSYLFGAFTRTLPEGFIVSRYAREGFFELCKVIALNFSLLWLVTRMAMPKGFRPEGDSLKANPEDVQSMTGSRLFRASCLALLAESAIFAVIAFSKLALYIDCFGFTPLRFQSIWLVCVLFLACILWAVSLLTGRKVFRLWMYFGAVSLSLLSLY